MHWQYLKTAKVWLCFIKRSAHFLLVFLYFSMQLRSLKSQKVFLNKPFVFFIFLKRLKWTKGTYLISSLTRALTQNLWHSFEGSDLFKYYSHTYINNWFVSRSNTGLLSFEPFYSSNTKCLFFFISIYVFSKLHLFFRWVLVLLSLFELAPMPSFLITTNLVCFSSQLLLVFLLFWG